MDADAFREAVEAETRTELDRLGSGNLLVALTAADLDPEAVLEIAAARERSAAEAFDVWAANASDDRVGDVSATRAEVHRHRADRILEGAANVTPAAHDDPVASHLATLDDTVERVGAAIGAALVNERAYTQFVSFFVNEADPETTDVFRSFKSDTDDAVEDWIAALESIDPDEDDRQFATAAAVEVIEVAYEDYADSLGELGLDPKPVC